MKNPLEKILLYVVLLEVMIAGSGRILSSGSITLRILLFFFAMCYVLFSAIQGKKFKREYVSLVMVFGGIMSFGSLTGLINGANILDVFEDVKITSYFLMLLFFNITITKYDDVSLVVKIMKISSVILLFGYLLISFLLENDIIDSLVFYEAASDTGEFVFKGKSAFFYKGFLFLCTGTFFFITENRMISRFMCGLFLIGISLTYTRGFVLCTAIIMLGYVLIINLKNNKFINIFLATTTLGFFIIPLYFSWFTESIGAKDDSDYDRIVAIEQVGKAMNSISIFTGHGFGIGIPIRPVHMEIAFLEIFHKQGLIGIAFWILIMLIIILKFLKAYKVCGLERTGPFLMSSFFVYIQSFTNPFISNSMGISMILLSIICLNVLSEKENKDETFESYHILSKV